MLAMAPKPKNGSQGVNKDIWKYLKKKILYTNSSVNKKNPFVRTPSISQLVVKSPSRGTYFCGAMV